MVLKKYSRQSVDQTQQYNDKFMFVLRPTTYKTQIMRIHEDSTFELDTHVRTCALQLGTSLCWLNYVHDIDSST